MNPTATALAPAPPFPADERTRSERRPTSMRMVPCRSDDAADLYFSEKPADLERAKELCTACPLREACLDGALERAEPWGVWGGAIFDAGRIIAVKRGRGRPRKNAAA